MVVEKGMKDVIGNLDKACTGLKNIQVFSEYAKGLQEIVEHTKEPLTLMVMGAFSTGKSTFINALVGEEIAAVEAKPTTAVVTKLCYGDKDVLKVYFRDGKSKIYSPSEFAKLTAVNDVEADNSIHERIDYVERQMPIEMLKQVTIIDSPGLNDVNEKHSEASERFVKNADSVLWMFSALQMGSKFEIEAMDKLTPRLKPIAIINKMDQINDDEDDSEEFLAKAKALFKDKVQAVIGISAKYALQGKLENNKLKVQIGNLDELKNAIETLVVPNRQIFKLNTLLDELGYFFVTFNNEFRSFKEKNKGNEHNDYNLYVQNEQIVLQTEETLGLIVDVILAYCEREAGRRNEQALFLLGVLYDCGIGVLQDEEKAMQFYRAAALKNHLGAMQNMYVYYREGTSDENKQSLFWLQKLAEAGDDEAQFDYAIDLMKKGDKEAAFNWCKKAAEQGNGYAQASLYKHYVNGIGVEEDEDVALEWLEKAVEQEIAEALFEYGEYYADEKEKVVYLKKAAEKNHNEAMYKLGECYCNGIGVSIDKAEAYKWYRKAAEQGHTESQNMVGRYLEEGWANVTKNEKEAVEWYRKAAEQGESDAQYNLACCLASGQGVVEDKAEAYKWYRKAAEQGLADAQNMVGRYLQEGLGGISKDEYEAVEWYRKAAEQGDEAAQYFLADCYFNGIGVAEDKVKAYKWYRKAAEQGNAEAQNWVGGYLQEGLGGIEKDEEEAIIWFRKAAEQDLADAQCNLADCLLYGQGIAEDKVEAYKWYRKAAEKGIAEAQNMVGRYFGEGWANVTKNEKEAVEWYRKAAEQGYDVAQHHLGEYLFYGKGIAEDKAEAYKWFKKSAEQGHAVSQNMVGRYLEKGWANVTKNEKEAVEWYRKAAEQGHTVAQYNVGVCLYNGEGVTKSKEEAYKWFKKAAEQGLSAAQNMMGRYTESGWGNVRINKYKAVEWYRKAAEQGFADAQYNLATCFQNGRGVTKDLAVACNWYRKAAEQGHENAKKVVAKIEDDIKKREEFFDNLVKSANNGVASAQYALAEHCLNGDGVAKNEAEAYKWYRKAAEQGQINAQYMVGRYLEEGWGNVCVNECDAVKWFKKAADQGCDEAKEKMAEYYEDGKGGLRQDSAKAAQYRKRAVAAQSSGCLLPILVTLAVVLILVAL